jgi:NADH dehydrogenase
MLRIMTEKNILLQDGQTISSATVLWAAGVKVIFPMALIKSLITRGNRIKVDRQNRVIGSQNIYAIGDLAFMETPNYPHGHPQVATTAIQQAKLLAENLLKIKAGKN